MFLEIAALGLFFSVGLFIHSIWLQSRLRASISRDFIQEIDGKLPEMLQKPLLDLTERVSRLSAETRDSLSDRLAKHFADTQERLERTLTTTLGQNRTELQSGLLKTTHSLESKFQSLELQVGARLETIGKNVENKLNENLKEGFKHFEKVQQHLAAAELKLAQLGAVGQSISDLNSLLKLPHLRGGFGEATLERLLADFLPAGSFELQYQLDGSSTERVDAVVKLPKQVLPIDSKFPREQVLPLFDSQDPEVLAQARKQLGEFVRGQARSIAKKYIKPEAGTTDMALLFLPSETLYFEVIRDAELFEHIAKLKVFPVSPNTLAISLHAISMGQEYYDMARGVERTIEEVKKARKHFDHFEKRFQDVGTGLKKAQDAFEMANTHLGRYGSTVTRLIGSDEETETLPLAPDLALISPPAPPLPVQEP